MAKRINGVLVAKGAYPEQRHTQLPGGRFYGLPVPQSIRRPLDPAIQPDLDEASRHRERINRSQKHRGVT